MQKPLHQVAIQVVIKAQFKVLASVLLMTLMVLQSVVSAPAQARAEASNHQIKSAMIFRMLNYTTWPSETNQQTFQLTFVGNDNALYQELQKAAKTVRVKNKPLVVLKTDVASLDAKTSQIVYVSESHNHVLNQLTNDIRRTDTLLITNKAKNRRDLMINFLSANDGSQTFEVNRSNIVFEKLSINRDLLLLGGTQMDVAELFRESEYSLQQIRSELQDNERRLERAATKLAKEQQLIAKQQQQLQSFKNDIADKTTVINEKQAQISNKEEQLEQRRLELDKLNEKVQLVAKNLQGRQSELNEKEMQNKQQQELLRDQGVQFALLNQQIAAKQAFLSSQQAQIQSLGGQVEQQQGTIVTQKKTLWISAAILCLFSVLILITLRVNASRRHGNEKLKQSRANMVTLGEIGRDLTSTRDLDQILDLVYQSLNRVLDAHVFLVGVLHKEEARLQIRLAIEQDQTLPQWDLELGDDQRPAVWCVNHKKEVIINNKADRLKYFTQSIPTPKHGEDMVTIIYQPLIIRDKIVGCLSLQSPNVNAYNAEQLEMIRTLSGYAAIAMANAISYTELEQQKLKVEEKGRKIIATQKQLVQAEKMASLGTLTAGVGHEINNPTNFTHAAIYMMKNEVDAIKAFLKQLAGGDTADPQVLESFEDHFADLIELIETASEGARRITAIVNNLQSFARADNSEQEKVSIAKLISSTVQLVQTKFDTISIQTQLTYDPPITCSPAKLSQVFMNLIINACQAIISRNRQQPTVKGNVLISTELNNNRLKLSVKDNGCGMNELVQQKIFEPFFTTKDVGNGTGLGMAITFGIIKDHNGTIDVESTEGEGSVISICLPL